jgi:hypothetical protein
MTFCFGGNCTTCMNTMHPPTMTPLLRFWSRMMWLNPHLVGPVRACSVKNQSYFEWPIVA